MRMFRSAQSHILYQLGKRDFVEKYYNPLYDYVNAHKHFLTNGTITVNLSDVLGELVARHDGPPVEWMSRSYQEGFLEECRANLGKEGATFREEPRLAPNSNVGVPDALRRITMSIQTYPLPAAGASNVQALRTSGPGRAR